MDQRHELLARAMEYHVRDLQSAVIRGAESGELDYAQVVHESAANFLLHAQAAADRSGLPLSVALALPWLRERMRV